MNMTILPGDLSDPSVLALLNEHLASMRLHSPPESIHALPPDGLLRADVSFWCAWDESELLGCGALKALSSDHGELKSMRTSSKHLRRGVASRMLEHLVAEAKRRGYRRLSLETGSSEAFLPALAMYQRHGFEYCGPFGSYREDPFSRFMTRSLT